MSVKFHLKRKNPTFRRTGSEQNDFSSRFAVKMFTMWRLLNSRFISLTASRLVLSSAVGHINRLYFLFVFVKHSWRWNFTPNKRGRQQLAIQVPAKQRRAATVGHASSRQTEAGGNSCNFPPNKHGRISIVGLRTSGRTYGRKWRYDLTKISRMDWFNFSYPWGCPRARRVSVHKEGHC